MSYLSDNEISSQNKSVGSVFGKKVKSFSRIWARNQKQPINLLINKRNFQQHKKINLEYTPKRQFTFSNSTTNANDSHKRFMFDYTQIRLKKERKSSKSSNCIKQEKEQFKLSPRVREIVSNSLRMYANAKKKRVRQLQRQQEQREKQKKNLRILNDKIRKKNYSVSKSNQTLSPKFNYELQKAKRNNSQENQAVKLSEKSKNDYRKFVKSQGRKRIGLEFQPWMKPKKIKQNVKQEKQAVFKKRILGRTANQMKKIMRQQKQRWVNKKIQVLNDREVKENKRICGLKKLQLNEFISQGCKKSERKINQKVQKAKQGMDEKIGDLIFRNMWGKQSQLSPRLQEILNCLNNDDLQIQSAIKIQRWFRQIRKRLSQSFLPIQTKINLSETFPLFCLQPSSSIQYLPTSEDESIDESQILIYETINKPFVMITEQYDSAIPINSLSSFDEDFNSIEYPTLEELLISPSKKILKAPILEKFPQQAKYIQYKQELNSSKDSDWLMQEIISQEVIWFLCISSKSYLKEVDNSIFFIKQYLQEFRKVLNLYQDEFFEAFDNPIIFEVLDYFQYIKQANPIEQINQFEILVPQEINDHLALHFDKQNSPLCRLYCHMLFDAINESINYIRPIQNYEVPDLWCFKQPKNDAQISLEFIYQKVSKQILDWSQTQAGKIFHISQLYSGILSKEKQLNVFREQNLQKMIVQDLDYSEQHWSIYDNEQMQVICELEAQIFEDLYSELTKILDKQNVKFGRFSLINNCSC